MSSTPDLPARRTSTGSDAGVDATVVEYEGVPDECVMWPGGADPVTQMRTWIAAREGSFVSLAEMR